MGDLIVMVFIASTPCASDRLSDRQPGFRRKGAVSVHLLGEYPSFSAPGIESSYPCDKRSFETLPWLR